MTLKISFRFLTLCAVQAMLECMTRARLENAQQDPQFARLFRGRPRRYRLPLAGGTVKVQQLAQLGCETPTINYAKHNGRPYRFFYAICSDVDSESPGQLVKVDTEQGVVAAWREEGVYCSEPMFVARPGGRAEDDGLILSSILWAAPHINSVGLIILAATNLSLIARVHFSLSGPVPKPLHGCFSSDWDFEYD